MRESVCEPVELRSMQRVSVNQERLGACKKVCVNLGSLGTDRRASGRPGDMQESVCDSGESVQVLSLRALRARALAMTTFRHSCGPIVEHIGTNWDQFESKLGAI